MKHGFAWLCALLLSLTTAGWARAADPKILHDVDEALIQAKAGHKAVLVDFMAKWCHSCYSMQAEVSTGVACTGGAAGAGAVTASGWSEGRSVVVAPAMTLGVCKPVRVMSSCIHAAANAVRRVLSSSGLSALRI